MQEQLSKNRIITELDRFKQVQCSVTSSTQEVKSKTYVSMTKAGKIVLRHNSFTSDIPIIAALKAMTNYSDSELTLMICGTETAYVNGKPSRHLESFHIYLSLY